MKRFLSMFMSIVMLLSITAGMNITANAEVFSGYCGAEGDGSNLTYNLDTDSGVLTISGTGKMYNYFSIPDIPWYGIRSSVKTVEIEYGVTSIGDYAFCECDSLTSITIPNSVTSIGDYAFEFCYSLTSITVDGNNQNYSSQDGVLFNKDKTVLIQYPMGNTRTSYTIPNSVTSIGSHAFDDCGSLTSITIPNSVTSIGDFAFYRCYSLTSITVDGNNQNYSSQDGVLFNKDKTVLIQYLIGNTRTSYTIPNSVTSIGNGAFEYCHSLTSVTIPNSVTSIGDLAFMYCYSLTSITVDGNNQNYSSQDGVLFNKDKTVLIQYPIGNTRTSYTIPNSVTSIRGYAFFNCNSLTSITIGNSVTSIGDYAFFNCNSLTSITIPNSVTSIGHDAFYSCGSLTSITIPDSVTSIGDSAFCYCDSLTSITIPNSVTNIGNSAFSHCDSLTSITIPNSVTSIGDWAFYDCNSLSDVYYLGSANEWNNISIGHSNDSLNNANIHYNSTGPENPGGSTDPENPGGSSGGGGSTGGGGSIGGGGGGGIVPAPTPEEPATTEPTTQPSTKPSAPTTTTTTVKKPSTVKVEKVTKGTKSFKVTWKKKTGVSGYQVQYATDKKFKKNKKTVTIAKKNATSKTIKKLKSKKTYYVRVRTYKIVNGKKVYSSWSKVKAVKTK